MFKFVKKEHYKKGLHQGKIVITYSVSEIIIGSLLVFATFLHIYIYLSTVAASKRTRENISTYIPTAEHQTQTKTNVKGAQ
ncbi:MAG: hypothetical protein A2751_01550 [Candidatus Doudnabacteria bacterium RIFCSPHIGHO2_01_FULL_46_14]|uniref:Uncharacterized protein n=1 Tax=Candidatus Doudnabacteria bacterium RIFCSPHIGHO2_01_FULL_46_14 TaxID=1817824 RepID=A0A1F5NJL1_9BACT|nr:MAG: hypothetical protein A2751_01550 [Candidatus Doudnabacteria bacterium RIFCSPHIGHO2_01_FULL_46_14]